jgi:hypothetical protein
MFISFCAVSTGWWLHWTVPTMVIGVLVLCDFMFGDDADFIYEPISFKAWQLKAGTERVN